MKLIGFISLFFPFYNAGLSKINLLFCVKCIITNNLISVSILNDLVQNRYREKNDFFLHHLIKKLNLWKIMLIWWKNGEWLIWNYVVVWETQFTILMFPSTLRCSLSISRNIWNEYHHRSCHVFSHWFNWNTICVHNFSPSLDKLYQYEYRIIF